VFNNIENRLLPIADFRSVIALLLLFSFLTNALYSFPESENKLKDWKLVKNDNEIKAYVEQGPMNDIKSVMVETVVIASLSQLVSIIKDTDHHEDWVYLNEESDIVEENDCCHWKYYGRTDAPWPATDRDFVVQSTLYQNPQDYSVTIIGNAVSGFLDKKDDCVRIKDSRSQWTLNPLGNNMVHVSFELKADIGGNIPNWLVNMAVAKGPFKTMNGFKEIVESGRYEDAKLPYIKEYHY
jgi:hypothetical protein